MDEKETSATVLSEADEMVILNVVCTFSALADLPENTGCQVCSGSSSICPNIDNPDNRRNISKNITFDVPEGELRELSIYAIDNSSNWLDGCPENISVPSGNTLCILLISIHTYICTVDVCFIS